MSLIYELKRNLQYGLYGLLLGLAVNHLGKNIYRLLRIENRKNLEIIGQGFLCALFLALLKTYTNQETIDTIQSQIPGIMFIAFFFGVQYLSFSTIQEVYGINQL
jgi:hypothetical protein